LIEMIEAGEQETDSPQVISTFFDPGKTA